MKLAILAALLCVAVGCDSAIVGAKCEKGFVRCGDECVNLQKDFRNCGRCENLCHDFFCIKGVCQESVTDAAVSEATDAAVSESDAMAE